MKNDYVLSHIEGLKAGTKVSVRGLSAELNVSEGTAYKAIKEAELRRLVVTKPKAGTFR
ncbi:MAG: GntR family transcriptional regulator, partial [Oscillospiraceae bacterium]|nr:GntR family transcriptional regulator [Oscillospiraceae bacterium]